MSKPSNTVAPSLLSRLLIWGFRRYVRRLIRRNFNAVRMANGAALAPEVTGPLICFANHPSWWDPLAAVLFTDQFFPNRHFHAPMDAQALKRYPILDRLGFFPLARGTSTSLKEFLRTCWRLLSDDSTILWLPPTGRFSDIRVPSEFMGGLGHIAGMGLPFSLLPIAVEYTFWNERCPELLMELGPVLKSAELPVRKSDRTALLEGCLARTQLSLSRKAMARNPDAFTTISLGRSGIGGSYDLVRRIAALFRGESFQSRHEPTSEPARPSARS
jgi:1-acyl-sn-glycerol-3-phosphate acyltransferase